MEQLTKINFKSRTDEKVFVIEVPKDLEQGFIKINNQVLSAEEIEPDSLNNYLNLSEEVKSKGELVYSIPESYDLYYFNKEFYEFYWDTASGCIFCKLVR